MPNWMIETPDEIQEREEEARAEKERAHERATQAVFEQAVIQHARERQFWAKEIFIFHEFYNLSLAGSPCFNHMLIALIRKADPGNTARLHVGYPVAVQMVQEWESSDPWDFYIANDIRPLLQGAARKHYDRRLGISEDATKAMDEAEEAIAEAEAILDGESDG